MAPETPQTSAHNSPTVPYAEPASVADGPQAGTARDWALALFRRSVLKQEKYRQIVRLLGEVRGATCLDIGGDNGVISYLLRQRGGNWHSADLDELTVASIRSLVGTDVHRIDGRRTPFPRHFFDLVVIVDFLEHIPTDREFARELGRILKPGGRLVINVPHLKPRSLLNRIRPLLGLTDERHGHVRPGYDLAGLQNVLGQQFVVQESYTYSKAFSETLDTGLNAAFELRGNLKRHRSRSQKGRVVTAADMQGGGLVFRLLAALYPLFWAWSKLDHLLFWSPGYKLIVRAAVLPVENTN